MKKRIKNNSQLFIFPSKKQKSKQKGLVILVSFSLIFLLSMSVVSASLFGDFWKKLTGKTTENNTNTTTPGCSDECSANGAKQCSGDGYKTCGNYDSDSCMEWSSGEYCQYGCSNGICSTGSTNIFVNPELIKLLNTKSIILYFPPKGTEGFDLCKVKGKSLLPSPPASTIAITPATHAPQFLFLKDFYYNL